MRPGNTLWFPFVLGLTVPSTGMSFVIGLVVFLIIYVLIRLLTERMEHSHKSPDLLDKKNRKIK
jgi:uncharacterized protein (DUF2062 family)